MASFSCHWCFFAALIRHFYCLVSLFWQLFEVSKWKIGIFSSSSVLWFWFQMLDEEKINFFKILFHSYCYTLCFVDVFILEVRFFLAFQLVKLEQDHNKSGFLQQYAALYGTCKSCYSQGGCSELWVYFSAESHFCITLMMEKFYLSWDRTSAMETLRLLLKALPCLVGDKSLCFFADLQLFHITVVASCSRSSSVFWLTSSPTEASCRHALVPHRNHETQLLSRQSHNT